MVGKVATFVAAISTGVAAAEALGPEFYMQLQSTLSANSTMSPSPKGARSTFVSTWVWSHSAGKVLNFASQMNVPGRGSDLEWGLFDFGEQRFYGAGAAVVGQQDCCYVPNGQGKTSFPKTMPSLAWTPQHETHAKPDVCKVQDGDTTSVRCDVGVFADFLPFGEHTTICFNTDTEFSTGPVCALRSSHEWDSTPYRVQLFSTGVNTQNSFFNIANGCPPCNDPSLATPPGIFERK
jgi:hypothetical protein